MAWTRAVSYRPARSLGTDASEIVRRLRRDRRGSLRFGPRRCRAALGQGQNEVQHRGEAEQKQQDPEADPWRNEEARIGSLQCRRLNGLKLREDLAGPGAIEVELRDGRESRGA